jgi:ATP-dependent DNA helicase RecG
MNRLVQGDVGSGKTEVAVFAAIVAINSGYQVALLAPTEILATQHFLKIQKRLQKLSIQVDFLAGKVKGRAREEALRKLKAGETQFLIGTHAIFQEGVDFQKLGLVIVDEQHRFGVGQRDSLRGKGVCADMLVMTATPIPRTLALTLYGDLDLSILDAMPSGRKPIITEIVPSAKRQETYERIRAELRAGRQAYIICPRIDEPDPEKEQAIIAKSVKEEAKRLKEKVFPEYEIDVLHSKMTPAKKDEAMARFAEGTTHILCATSVVEVGVNVPNATVIVIEGAERFGLAQLHQLRGRVIRSTHQSYCFVLPESAGEVTRARMKAFVNAKNGFELAEYDLALRGAGELTGGRQWGVADIAMEALKNLKLVEAARREAAALVAHDPDLSQHPALRARVSTASREMHLE